MSTGAGLRNLPCSLPPGRGAVAVIAAAGQGAAQALAQYFVSSSGIRRHGRCRSNGFITGAGASSRGKKSLSVARRPRIRDSLSRRLAAVDRIVEDLVRAGATRIDEHPWLAQVARSTRSSAMPGTR